MFISMAITLYTSRVVLQALGIDDYGIYNVVGGIVTMFSAVYASLSVSISRFITFALGEGGLIRHTLAACCQCTNLIINSSFNISRICRNVVYAFVYEYTIGKNGIS